MSTHPPPLSNMELPMFSRAIHPYLLVTVWGVLLVLSSWLLRGTSSGEWVDATLYLAAGLWLANAMTRPRVR